MAKEKEEKSVEVARLPLHIHKGDRGEVRYNDLPDEVWAKIPPMGEVETFRMAQRHYIQAREITGDEKKGQREVISGVHVSGTHMFTARFPVSFTFKTAEEEKDPNSVGKVLTAKICAFQSADDNGPVALMLEFNGKENGFVKLYRSNPMHQLLYLALRLSPQLNGNILGLLNFSDTPPDFEYVDLVGEQQTRVDSWDKSQKATAEFYAIVEDNDEAAYALAVSMNPNAPYNGGKSKVAVKDYMRTWIEQKPELVLERIKSLDQIKLDVELKEALDRGIIKNDKEARGFIFPDRGNKKGIVNYLETDTDEAQLRILKTYFLNSDNSKDKVYLRTKLEESRS